MIGNYLKGWCYWQSLKFRYHINYKKVVIVLSDENPELDRQVIRHLPDFMKRKCADYAVIYCKEGCKGLWENEIKEGVNTKVEELSDKNISLLYSFYCFAKFFDNMVFTNTNTPKDNMLGKYLRETDVNEEDAACLALYHLRCVPSLSEGDL